MDIEMRVVTDSTNHAEAKDRPKKNKEDEKTDTVPFHKLFLFADFIDVILMLVGTIGAVGNGLGLPLMTVLFGQLSDSYGTNQNNRNLVHLVSKVTVFEAYCSLPDASS